MYLILLSIFLLAIAFAGISVKILIKKDGKFAGTCASNNPMIQEKGGSCGLCGAKSDEKCLND